MSDESGADSSGHTKIELTAMFFLLHKLGIQIPYMRPVKLNPSSGSVSRVNSWSGKVETFCSSTRQSLGWPSIRLCSRQYQKCSAHARTYSYTHRHKHPYIHTYIHTYTPSPGVGTKMTPISCNIIIDVKMDFR